MPIGLFMKKYDLNETSTPHPSTDELQGSLSRLNRQDPTEEQQIDERSLSYMMMMKKKIIFKLTPSDKKTTLFEVSGSPNNTILE